MPENGLALVRRRLHQGVGYRADPFFGSVTKRPIGSLWLEQYTLGAESFEALGSMDRYELRCSGQSRHGWRLVSGGVASPRAASAVTSVVQSHFCDCPINNVNMQPIMHGRNAYPQ
jgi:hypothetical protein